MCISEKTREYNGEKYNLVSDILGMKPEEAEAMKKEYATEGYNVQIYCNDIYPDLYPKGQCFVYAKKD